MYSVILVDDESLFLNYLHEQVDWRRYGLNVVKTFTSSTMALNYLKSAPSIDAVLTDMRMPGVSGIDLIEMTPSPVKSRVYFIALSGYSDFPLVKRAFLAGASDYLLKVDVNGPEFDHTIEKLVAYLNARRQANAPLGDVESPDTMAEIKEYIACNISMALALNDLAARFGFSPGYLSALFSRREGMTLSEFITNARVERARALLESTDLNVTEIAYDVGYNSLEHFSRTFKKITNRSPRDYRKRM